ARDEDRRIDSEIEAVELLAAQEIGDRNALLPFVRQIKESVLDLERNFLLRRRGECCLREAADFGEQDACLARVDARAGNGLLDVQAGSSESCASCSAWCSAASALTISSSSPSMMRSIL